MKFFFLLSMLCVAAALASACTPGPGCTSDPEGVHCLDAAKDCAGYCTHRFEPDACGVCGGTNQDLDKFGACCIGGVIGCDDICNSGVTNDACGVCGGHNETMDAAGVCCDGTVGCDGVCNSNKTLDFCGVCDGKNATLDHQGACCNDGVIGCDGICNSGKVRDHCQVCGGNNATLDAHGTCCHGDVIGCDGVCGSGKVLNDCGDCNGELIRRSVDGICCGLTHLDPDGHCCSVFDCEGRCGTAVVDACGVCNGNNATMDARGVCCEDSARGCDGFCFGAERDICGVCGQHGESCCGAHGQCSNHGVCSAQFKTCKCNVGWTGFDCALSQHTCDGVSCGLRGSCVEEDGSAVCVCEEGWAGTRCERPRCHDRGVFVVEDNACECFPGYDPRTLCLSCTPVPDGHARVCLAAPNFVIPKVVPLREADLIYMVNSTSIGDIPVAPFPPESEFNGTQYDCACTPVARAALARYTIQDANEQFSRIAGETISHLTTTTEELEALVTRTIRGYEIQAYWPPGIIWLLMSVAAVIAPVIVLAAVSILFRGNPIVNVLKSLK